MNKEKGSILVLTLIAVLILSLTVLGLLSVGTTENATTQNFTLNKLSYYAAVQGVEDIRGEIASIMDNEYNPDAIAAISKSLYGTREEGKKGVQSAYMTGTLEDLENLENGTLSEQPTIKSFNKYPVPQLRATSLEIKYRTKVWKVTVTSEIIVGNIRSFTELVVGLYTVIPEESGTDEE
ncbi:MAG: hypothetical protein GY765_36035 [bacterium]|nr:hypothetical protein [bacterium]